MFVVMGIVVVEALDEFVHFLWVVGTIINNCLIIVVVDIESSKEMEMGEG